MAINLEAEEGCLPWHVSIPKIDFEYKELSFNENNVVRLVAKKVASGSYDFTIITAGIYEEILAKEKSVASLKRVLEYLSVIEDTPVYDPVFKGCTIPFPPDERTTTEKYRVCSLGRINIGIRPNGPKEMTDLTWDKVTEALQGYNPFDGLIPTFFRQALIQSDSMGQFMLLYNIMLQISDDKGSIAILVE